MTGLPRPHHMSTASAIRFRDPFASHKSHPHDQPSWPSLAHRHDFNRALTPPPDMNGVSQPRPVHCRPAHTNYPGDGTYHQHAYQAAIGSYVHQELGQPDLGRGYATQPSSRTMSPVQQARSHTVDEHTRQHNSRASQASAIAPSFQIPRSVNDSGGSLSELAAQVSFGHADRSKWMQD